MCVQILMSVNVCADINEYDCVACADIDECRTVPGICRNGRCKNTIGSFACQCQPGYDLTADRKSCRGDRCYVL
jgi:hypothetical protein